MKYVDVSSPDLILKRGERTAYFEAVVHVPQAGEELVGILK